MIRQTAEILDSPDWGSSSKSAANGNASNGDTDPAGHQMEVDDNETSQNTDVVDADKEQQYQESLQKVLVYGQDLKSKFGNQTSRYYQDALAELFSMFAYSDPRTSPMEHLFGQDGALAVAEELNSAILGTLCSFLLHRLIWSSRYIPPLLTGRHCC